MEADRKIQVAGGILFAVVLGTCYLGRLTTPQASAGGIDLHPPVYSGQRWQATRGTIACASRSAYQRVRGLAAQGDTLASRRFFLDPTNGCTIVPAGTEIAIEAAEDDSGTIQIRRVGDPTSLYLVPWMLTATASQLR